MAKLNIKDIWQTHLGRSIKQTWDGTVFSGFNANVDVIVRLNPQAIQRLIANNPQLDTELIQQTPRESIESIRTPEEFLSVLIDRLRTGKSLLMVCENPGLFDWLNDSFYDRRDQIGGQAGIISNQMAMFNARSILYSPILSPRQAAIMNQDIRFPVTADGDLSLKPLSEAARSDDPTRCPWVFEYGKNEVYDFGFEEIKTPRANRIIIVSRNEGLSMNFRPEMNPYLKKLGYECDVAFVAGYHLGGAHPDDFEIMEQYFVESADSLRLFRSGNTNLKVHFEYVPMKETHKEAEMLSRITKEVNSFGINETEICQVLTLYGHEALSEEIRVNERAYALYKAALVLQREFNLERVHIHNLGYYVLVLSKPYPSSVEKVRQSCLFGSAVNACRALHGRFVLPEEMAQASATPLSAIGLQQLQAFAREVMEKESSHAGLNDFATTGILEFPDHYVVVVPTQIVQNPVVTVGMGDTISSCSYAMEVIGR